MIYLTVKCFDSYTFVSKDFRIQHAVKGITES